MSPFGFNIGTNATWCLTATSPLQAGSPLTIAPCNSADSLQVRPCWNDEAMRLVVRSRLSTSSNVEHYR